jgi:hypothetical protein
MNKLSLIKIIDNLPFKVISYALFSTLSFFICSSSQIKAAESNSQDLKTQGHRFRQTQKIVVSDASVKVIPPFTPRSAHSLKKPVRETSQVSKEQPPTSNGEVAYNTVEMSHKFQSERLKQQTIDVNKAAQNLSKNDLDSLAYEYLIYLSHRYKDPSFRENIQDKSKLIQRQEAAKTALDKQKFARRILAQQYLATLGHKFMAKGRLFSEAIKRTSPIIDDENKQLPNITTDKLRESYDSIPDGEELLLVIKIDDLVLDAIFAFKQGNGALIGLDSIFAVLDFPIDVDIENALASGWFINEQQKFEFSLPENTKNLGHILVNNKSLKLIKFGFS